MNWIIKNKQYRKLYKKVEIKKNILKCLLYNNNSKFVFKIYYDNLFKKITYKSSIAKLRNYCSYLNNSRSVFKKFKLSRHKIKLLAANSYIIGLKKSSF